MKGWKSRLKKGMVFALSLAMAVGLAPAMSGGAGTVQAAEGVVEPSVSVYATKEQMMDGTFKPGDGGTATNIGKILFGKNSSGNAQEWYILGKDNGVSGDNVIVFATNPISGNQAFSSDLGEKDCNEDGGDYDNPPLRVYPNHYGVSDLRKALQNMASGESYFTEAEQNLMNDTTVTTYDLRNNQYYTTTDKLYALQGNCYDTKFLRAGSDGGTELAMSSYWSNAEKPTFWLRSHSNYISSDPSDSSDSKDVLFAEQACGVGYANCTNEFNVRPASNLKLTDVLFASAAEAASSDRITKKGLTQGAAMTLRLDGTNLDIGEVTYNTSNNYIEAKKGNIASEVYLIVQWKEGDTDWYGCEKISNPTMIIWDIDYSKCKIWLETKGDDGMIYAVNATEDTSVPQAPDITGQPQDKTIKAGESATFTVEASGTDLAYQWQIDLNNGYGWQNISSATGKEYTISEVNIKDSGLQVRCVVSNAGGSITTNAATLTVTENTVPSPDPVNYDIIDGANSAWTQNTDGSLVIRGSGEIAKFQNVKVDGTAIGAENYTVTEGSTIITLKADYLRTLSAGSHTFEIVWTDGSASTAFTVNSDSTGNTGNNPDNNTDNSNTDNSNTDNSNTGSSPSAAQPQSTANQKDAVPKTGEHTPLTWLYLPAILSGAGLILTAKKGRKRREASEE